MNIRVATPADAEAITAIYGPVVENTSISFELSPPGVDEMRGRIVKTLADLPWLVSEDAQGLVNGYVYASKHRERPAYQWSVDVTAYVREDARGAGVGKKLYQALFPELVALGYFQAFAGIALPNAPASRCTSLSASSTSAPIAKSASSWVRGTTWAGGRGSFASRQSLSHQRRFQRRGNPHSATRAGNEHLSLDATPRVSTRVPARRTLARLAATSALACERRCF